VRAQLAVPAGPPLQPGSVTAAHELPSVAAMRRLLREAPPGAAGRSLARATTHAVAHDHARLWRLLAEAALGRLCWSVAERAYAALRDPAGVSIVRRLAALPEPWHQRAEVDALAGRVDAAQAAFTRACRLDLAVQLRSRLGHWQRVLDLLTTAAATGGGIDGEQGGLGASSEVDARLMRTAHLRTGDYWADRHGWRRAIPHYAAAGAHEALVECYTRADDFPALAALASTLPPGAPLAVDAGTRLASAGLVEEAAAAFLRGGDARSAVATASAFQRWELAARLGRDHGLAALAAQLRGAATPTTPVSAGTTTLR
jgi:WD repeat-containing protein 35